MTTATETDDCAVCEGTGTGSRPESARVLVTCTTCGTRACNSPCFSMHREPETPGRAA